MCLFARVDASENTVPDDSTILRFRLLKERHKLTLPISECRAAVNL